MKVVKVPTSFQSMCNQWLPSCKLEHHHRELPDIHFSQSASVPDKADASKAGLKEEEQGEGRTKARASVVGARTFRCCASSHLLGWDVLPQVVAQALLCNFYHFTSVQLSLAHSKLSIQSRASASV